MIARLFLLGLLLFCGVFYTNGQEDGFEVEDGFDGMDALDLSDLADLEGMDPEQLREQFMKMQQQQGHAPIEYDFLVEDEEAGEDEEEEGEEGEDQYHVSSTLRSSFLFPSTSEDGVILLGEDNDLLVGLTNTFEYDINITAIRLSLLHPQEPTFYYIQNCTAETYFQVLKPKQTQTFYYPFMPDSMLQPRDYVVVANVYFEVPTVRRHYVFPALNLTFNFDDAPNKIDSQLIFIILSVIGVFGFIVYLILASMKTGKRRAISAHTAEPTEVHGDWISHLQQGSGKKKKKGLKKSYP